MSNIKIEKINWEATANLYKKRYEQKCKEYEQLKRLAEEISLKYFQEQQLKYELLEDDGK